jgi:HSP20 family protein
MMAKSKKKEKKNESGAIQKGTNETPQSLTPFSYVRKLMDEMDRFAGGLGVGQGLLSTLERDLPGGAWAPQVEMFERDDELVLRADLPGLAKDDVKVELADNTLTIEGERRNERTEKGEGLYRSERSYGRFYRRLPLPQGVDTENANASFRDGVLEITMPAPKREPRKARQLEIRGETAPKSKAKAA